MVLVMGMVTLHAHKFLDYKDQVPVQALLAPALLSLAALQECQVLVMVVAVPQAPVFLEPVQETMVLALV